MDLPILGTLYKWNRTVFLFVGPIQFWEVKEWMIPAKWRPLKYIWTFLPCTQCLAFLILTIQIIFPILHISLTFLIGIPAGITLQHSKFWPLLHTLFGCHRILNTRHKQGTSTYHFTAYKVLYYTYLLFSWQYPYEVDSTVFYKWWN